MAVTSLNMDEDLYRNLSEFACAPTGSAGFGSSSGGRTTSWRWWAVGPCRVIYEETWRRVQKGL